MSDPCWMTDNQIATSIYSLEQEFSLSSMVEEVMGVYEGSPSDKLAAFNIRREESQAFINSMTLEYLLERAALESAYINTLQEIGLEQTCIYAKKMYERTIQLLWQRRQEAFALAAVVENPLSVDNDILQQNKPTSSSSS